MNRPPSDLPSTVQTLRVLHLVAGNLFGGVERLVLSLIQHRALSPSLQMHVATCFAGQFEEDLLKMGLKVERLPELRRRFPWTVWRSRRALRRVIEANRIDVVLCHGGWTYALLAPAARERSVLWLHGSFSPNEWPDRTSGKMRPLLTIAASDDVRKSTLKYITGPIEVLHAPYHPSAAQRSREEVRKQLGVGQDSVVIVQVSRIEPGKGHELHLRALNMLSETTQWHCWFVGGPQRAAERQLFDTLREQAKSLGLAERVTFLGQRQDVADLLHAADVYCQPNIGPEGFGLTLVEAMAAGIPVVTSDIGAASEVIDASCGMLTDPGNVHSVATALKMLIVTPELRSKLGAAGPARAERLCSPALQMSRLSDLLQSFARQAKYHN